MASAMSAVTDAHNGYSCNDPDITDLPDNMFLKKSTSTAPSRRGSAVETILPEGLTFVDFSNTKITGMEVSRTSGAFNGVPDNVFIYMPAGNTTKDKNAQPQQTKGTTDNSKQDGKSSGATSGTTSGSKDSSGTTTDGTSGNASSGTSGTTSGGNAGGSSNSGTGDSGTGTSGGTSGNTGTSGDSGTTGDSNTGTHGNDDGLEGHVRHHHVRHLRLDGRHHHDDHERKLVALSI